MGGCEKLMETLQQRLAEQKERHEGGKKWIGTAGTSPFGAYGYNPEGVRIGQDEKAARPARGQGLGQARVQESRRRGRARHAQHQAGAAPPAPIRARRRGAENSISTTPIRSTASNAGWLDLKLRARAAQRGEGAAAPRYRRLDGRARPHLRRAVLGRAHRVQASRVFLLPQLPLRGAVEGRAAPAQRRRRRPRRCCTPTIRATS